MLGAGDVRLSTQASPSADVLQNLLLQLPGETQTAVYMLRAGPGGAFDLEAAPGMERLLYVLGGPVALESGEFGEQLAAGDAAFVPTGMAVHIAAVEDAALEVVDVLVPASAATQGLPPTVVHGDDAASYALQDGKLRVRILIDRERLGAEGAALSLLTAHPGAGTPLHEHVGSDEIVVVLEGTAKMLLGDVRLTLAPGSAFHIPAGTKHSMAVETDVLRVVQVYAPGGPEQRFKKGEAVD